MYIYRKTTLANNSQWTSTHLDRALTAIRSCGVGSSVWETKEGKYEWMSLMGGDKKQLLRNLPDKFEDILKPDKKDAVTKLCKVRVHALIHTKACI